MRTPSLPGRLLATTAVLVSGLLATIVLARAGSRIFWKAQGALPDAMATRILPAELAGVGMLACALLLLAVFAGPAQRYARAAAAQLLDPAAYITAVLLAEPVRRQAGMTNFRLCNGGHETAWRGGATLRWSWWSPLATGARSTNVADERPVLSRAG